MKKIILIFSILFFLLETSVPVFGLELKKNNVPKILLPDNFSEILKEKGAKDSFKKLKKAGTKQQQKSQKKSQKKDRKTSKKAKYHNGDISKNILINEIFPHAKKDDRRQEWIELHNHGKENINLGNWRLDDKEGGSRPYILPDTVTIASREFLVITAPQSKISLGNEHDQVRLFDYQGKKIDDVEYEQAAAGKSYSRTVVTKEDGQKVVQWFFDEQNTPGRANPDLQEMSGSIVGEPVWGNQYIFMFLTSKNERKKIIFQENLVQGPLAKATFTKGTKAKLLVKKAPDARDIFELKQYEILGAKRSGENKNILSAIIIGGVFIIGAITLIVMKLLKFYGEFRKDNL